VRIVPPLLGFLLGFRLGGSDMVRRAFVDSLRMAAFRP